MKYWILGLAIGLLTACGGPPETSPSQPETNAPPPMPEGAETVIFERPEDSQPIETPAPDPQQVARSTPDTEQSEEPEPEQRYWGIAPGEPVPILWDELMPEGSYEAMLKEQEAFFAMIEKRYMASQTTLGDAAPFSEIEEGSELDYMPQFGGFETVEDLDGELIRIPGYVVPLDFNSRQRHNEFLFVPYMGACLHAPPPPPNQVIFVRADPAVRIRDIWVPYWLEGTLSAEKIENDLGDAAYALRLDDIEPYPMPG